MSGPQFFVDREYPLELGKLRKFIFRLSKKDPDVALGLLHTVASEIADQTGIQVEIQIVGKGANA